MNDFTHDMDELAAEIAIAAGSAEVALGDKIDAFKALMPYYALQVKNRGRETIEINDLPNFDNFQNKIHAVK